LERVSVSLFPLLGLATGLAMDAFSVAVAVGLALGCASARQCFRLSFHFGLFQFLMPVVGWAAGATVSSHISAYDHWLALALLGYVGGRMIWESVTGHDEQFGRDPTKWPTLIILSLATSIDALAVGLSMAFLRVPVLMPAVVIGLVAGGLTLAGIRLGRHAGQVVGPWMARAGGVVLLLIGVKIVVEHTVA
jgi:putative Mn2+ efflux pump MntP